jgi:hypothetical protein
LIYVEVSHVELLLSGPKDMISFLGLWNTRNPYGFMFDLQSWMSSNLSCNDALGSLLSCFAHGESRPGIAARGSRALWLLEIHWGGVIFGADDDFVGATVGVTNLGMFFLMVPLLMPYMRWPIRLEILYYISTSLIHIDWREFQRGSGVDLLQ